MNRLVSLRKLLGELGLDGYFVPSADPHQSEYVPELWRRREALSGFDGSRGDLLVGSTDAWLWTDSRYFVQAEQQLSGTGIRLCRLRQKGEPTIEDVISANFSGKAMGVDPATVTWSEFQRIEKALIAVGGRLVALNDNLVDRVWDGRPLHPSSVTKVHDTIFSGEVLTDRLSRVRKIVSDEFRECLQGSTDYCFALSSLDQIAWLFSIRGQDVEFNPVKIAHAVLLHAEAVLFIDQTSVDEAVRNHLVQAGVEVRDYEGFPIYLEAVSQTHLLLEDSATSAAIVLGLDKAGRSYKLVRSPVLTPRACKNVIEQEGMRNAHLRDAVAMVKALSWVVANWQSGIVTELAIDDTLFRFRAEQLRFVSPSFATIAGYAEHGAIVHYRATDRTSSTVDDRSLLLIDSGGQYLDGTTDITRTIHLGMPTAEERRHYTLVLKGHLALSRAVFPEGTDGNELDVLARDALWSHGLDYGHGTGHGVGCYLCVHEGPQGIMHGRRTVPLALGMVLSNEPGFYLDGHYGIRIENLLLVVPSGHKTSTDGREFYRFETLTLVPYCRALIDVSLLSPTEVCQVNQYQLRVLEALTPFLEGEALLWLQQECQHL